MTSGIKCDECGVFVTESQRSIHVERRGSFLRAMDSRDVDFCGEECLMEWASSQILPKTPIISEETDGVFPCVRCDRPTGDANDHGFCPECANFVAKGGKSW